MQGLGGSKGEKPRVYEFPPLLQASQNQGLDGGSFTNRQTGSKFGNFGTSVHYDPYKGDGNLSRRRTSSAGGFGKSIEDQINTRYRHVSIFSWYPPKKLMETPKVSPLTSQFSLRRTNNASMYRPRNPPMPFSVDNWTI